MASQATDRQQPGLTFAAAAARVQASSLVAAGRDDEATAVLEAASAALPTDVELIGDLAALALRRGDAIGAIRWSRRALQLEPAHLASRFSHAMGLLASGAASAAEEALRELAEGQFADALRREHPALADIAAAELARPGGAPAAAAPVAPGESALPVCALPLAARFDILVKLLYVLHRRRQLPDWVTVDVPALYRRHIQLRTGGVEPGDAQRKPTLDAYVQQFDALIDHMVSQGFDAAQPVRLSSINGMPCDGAHRMATAMALGVPAAIETVGTPGWRWDLPWFQQHGFSHEECNVLLQAWVRLRPDTAGLALLWSPAEGQWPQIEAALAEHAEVVGTRTLELPRAAFDEMVRDVYSVDCGPVAAPEIERKITLLRAYPARIRLVWMERRGETPAPVDLKRLVRERFDAAVPAQWFVTLHLSDSPRELRHLADIFASEHNLQILRRRRPLPATFLQRLQTLHQALEAHGVQADDACVVGGSVLAALGLRASDDIDVTLRHDVRHRHFDRGITQLADGVDLVTEGYARSFGPLPPLCDDGLIDHPSAHFRVRGIRFAAPQIVRERKQHQRRDKDLRDLPLLAEFDALTLVRHAEALAGG